MPHSTYEPGEFADINARNAYRQLENLRYEKGTPMSDKQMNIADFQRLMEMQKNNQPQTNMAEHHVDEERKAQALMFLQQMMGAKDEFKSVLKMLEELEIEPRIVSMYDEDHLVIPLSELVAKEFKAMTGVDISALREEHRYAGKHVPILQDQEKPE